MDLVAGDRSALPLHLLLFLCGAVLGSLLVCAPTKLLPFIVGACVLLCVAARSLIRPMLLVYIVMSISATASIFTNAFESVEAAGVSLSISGLGWIFIASMSVFIIGGNLQRTPLPSCFYPFFLFSGWTVLRWLIAFAGSTGIKDILFYSLPPLIGVYTLFALSIYQGAAVKKIEKTFLYSTLIPVSLCAVLLPLGLMAHEDRDALPLLHPRAVSLYLLIPLSLGLAQWRYGESRSVRRTAAVVSILAFVTILVTLSRMASVTALMLLFTSTINPAKFWRTMPRVVLAPVVAVFLLFQIPAYRERSFFAPTHVAIGTGSFERLNSAGRFDYMWPATFNHALKNPVVGWGVSSAALLVAGVAPRPKATNYLPHNEYLNTFHDMGIIGLLLLLWGWLALFWRHGKGWRTAQKAEDFARAKWHMATTLSIGALLFTSCTDNGFHYAFVGGPLFIIAAVALWTEESPAPRRTVRRFVREPSWSPQDHVTPECVRWT